jgi:hypothetical protein
MTRSAERNRRALRSKVEGLLLTLAREISKLGRSLAQQIGVNPALEDELKQSDSIIRSLCETASKTYQTVIEETAQSLQDDLKKDFSSPLMDSYVNYAAEKIDHADYDTSAFIAGLQRNLGTLKTIAQKINIPIKGALSATTTGIATPFATAGGGLATATQVSGSMLHTGIYSVGKLIGYNFKPWQAVNLAKNIGNGVAVVGLVLSVASLFADAASEVETANNERKISKAKRDLINAYQTVADEILEQFRGGLHGIENELFGQVETVIGEARASHEQSQASSNQTLAAIVELRRLSNALLVAVTD